MSDKLQNQPAPSTYIPVSNMSEGETPEEAVPVAPVVPVQPAEVTPEQPAEQEVNIDTGGGDVTVENPAPAEGGDDK